MSDYAELLDQCKFDDKGLMTAVAQDADTGEVLMLAFMNRDALKMTLERGVACYWSRSRNKFWVKGETSGHMQEIQEITIDCDMDAVVMKVKQKGGACHVGYRSCFYRKIEQDGTLTVTGEKVFDENDVYGKKK